MCSKKNVGCTYRLEFKVYIDKKQYSQDVNLTEAEYSLLLNANQFIEKKQEEVLVLNNTFFNEDSIVKDEHRYIINIDENKACKKPIILNNSINTCGNIVLLLESPHRSEYRSINIYKRLVPIGPAQGGRDSEAGGAIAGYLDKAIEHILSNNQLSLLGSYRVVIVNPIQFQTSLGSLYVGKLRGGLRNKIWNSIWEINDGKSYIVQESFVKRIHDLEPSLIINACTSNLKKNVNNVLNSSAAKYDKVNINHPSNNWIKNNF